MSNRTDKPMLAACNLIQRMRGKGICFDIMSLSEAETYLIEKNNYLRTASYRKLFEKYTNGQNRGRYMNLDFAYLVELSTIDMHLRYLIEKMCLDIEHALGVRLLNLIENDPNEDGYQIVEDFLDSQPSVRTAISHAASSPYVKDLAQKYLQITASTSEIGKTQYEVTQYNDCPAWVLIEMLSFGDIIRLYDFYCQRSCHKPIKIQVLNLVRSLRNAVAHNNCVLLYLRTGICSPQQAVSSEIAFTCSLKKTQIQKHLSSRTMLEFAALLVCYKALVGNEITRHRITELKAMFRERIASHEEYFRKNLLLVASYKFATEMIDGLFPTTESAHCERRPVSQTGQQSTTEDKGGQ